MDLLLNMQTLKLKYVHSSSTQSTYGMKYVVEY